MASKRHCWTVKGLHRSFLSLAAQYEALFDKFITTEPIGISGFSFVANRIWLSYPSDQSFIVYRAAQLLGGSSQYDIKILTSVGSGCHSKCHTLTSKARGTLSVEPKTYRNLHPQMCSLKAFVKGLFNDSHLTLDQQLYLHCYYQLWSRSSRLYNICWTHASSPGVSTINNIATHAPIQ